MAKKDLIKWMRYWDQASSGPNFYKVKSIADMHICRGYNPIMQGGVMSHVTDKQMWDALQDYRRLA